jgi:hypothetical protein
MTRLITSMITLVLLGGLLVYADTNVTGEWTVTFAAPSGPMEFAMYLDQEGAKLSGRLTSDTGEFPLTGTLDRDQITIVWSLPDRGEMLEITFTGKVDGNSIEGTAKVGKLGQGRMSAERTQ